MIIEETLTVCKNTRAIAAKAIYGVLRDALKSNDQISEEKLRDRWLGELRNHHTIFPDGWYMPPPHGIGVLFGKAAREGRQNYRTLRSEDMWPKKTIFLGDKNEISYLFASPVDRQTGVIGDFGLTVYLGNRQEVKDHLKRCMQINLEILNFIEVGKTFSEVYRFAEKIIARQGLTNEVTSTTDPAGTDFGHTIPATYFDWNENEQSILENGESDWESVKNMINKKRVFVNSVETMIYQPGMAITLEPRLTVINNPATPMGSFHTIVVINSDGTKELLTNFDAIFQVVGMDYML